jgi:hypothetical protein
MPKITLNTIGSRYGSIDALNDNFDAIEAAFENTFSRDGEGPNTLQATVDANSQRIVNLPDPVGNTEPATKGWVEAQPNLAAASAIAAAASAAAAAVSEVNAEESASIIADWEWKDEWATGEVYVVNNIVAVPSGTYEGWSFICVVGHTASAAFDTDFGAGKWDVLAKRGSAGAGTGDMLAANNLSDLTNLSAARTNLAVPSATGGGASGNWGINITGNAETATTAQNTRKGGGEKISNIANGDLALVNNTSGTSNTANGYRALENNTGGSGNTALGTLSLTTNWVGSDNTAVGVTSLYSNTTGNFNTAIGDEAMYSNTNGGANTAVGQYALRANTTADGNTAVGRYALTNNTTGFDNTAVGRAALSNLTGYNFRNTAIGADALLNVPTTTSNNTAVGADALKSSTLGFGGCTGLGFNAQVTATNQIQLGNSVTTTYVYGTVQNRSDLRDKADVRDTALGLSFINALRPVDYKWDLRDDYRPDAPKLEEDATAEQIEAHKAATQVWLEAVKQDNLVHDGSKKRNRYHHGLIAQEVKQLLDQQGIDFGGYQDHKLAGGNDVLSIGYDELIAPLIKAVQELTIQNKNLLSRIEVLENT